MKYKNYKSAIHNFTHSFLSIDYLKSGRLAVNVLIDLYNLNLETSSKFDFINKTIEPNEAESKESRELINDYINWLPTHFEQHSCDLVNLEKLEITISTDFENTISSERNKADAIFQIAALTKWKVFGREEEILEISQSELISKKMLTLDNLPRIREFGQKRTIQ